MDVRKREETSARAAPDDDKFHVSAPSISLPKGGGAIRGIGEKFAANPVTGTGSMSVPIATSPGRSGFGPALALSYDSGAGNGPFGFGWSLSLPSITRKTDKGLPLYRDEEESDVFLLSGAEDLVPELDAAGHVAEAERKGFRVRRYRPRVEGLFARIERWTSATDTYWRSITRDNITTIYGRSSESRIVDPADPSRIFSWLICETTDGKGNAVVYRYAEEDSEGVNRFAPHERNRPVVLRADAQAARRPKAKLPGRYLKRIQYGNIVSRLVNPPPAEDTWMFEVVLDYDDGHWDASGPLEPDKHMRVLAAATIDADSPLAWPARPDPFSSYRAGFEVRTYRRCQRVLMFHRFAELSSEPCLVRSTVFDYADFNYATAPTPPLETELAHDGSTRVASFLKRVTQYGHVQDKTKALVPRDGAKYLSYFTKPLPPVEFTYSRAEIQETPRDVDQESLVNLPVGMDGTSYQWVDLDGEGLSGVLTEQAGAWYYKRNLSALAATGTDGQPVVKARLSPLETVTPLPSPAARAGGHQFLDLAGNGRLDVVQLDGPLRGRIERTADLGWDAFVPFEALPNIDLKDPNLRFVDLTGDGHADILITDDQALVWYPSLAERGFAPAERVARLLDEERGPNLVFADGEQSIYLADMSGDGLSDLVRIRNGEICYWPNLGYGGFGAKITMDHAPWFDSPDLFDHRRLRVADIDGTGTSDLIYLHADGVDLYLNLSGNGFSRARRLARFPRIDSLSSVTLVDLFGNGTACLVWSSPLPGDATRPMRYIDLMGGQKPHLLTSVTNNLGARTLIEYTPSTQFYLEDRRAGQPWVTRIPFPVHCVSRVTVEDDWRRTSFSTSYSYHHGYFDGDEREFRGFGRVEQVDTQRFDDFAQANHASPFVTQNDKLYQPPVKSVTWYHVGAAVERKRILGAYAHEYFPARYASALALAIFHERELPESTLDAGPGGELDAFEWREALRACKGAVLRQEVFELDLAAWQERGEHKPVRLFSAAQHNCRITRLQPRGANRHAVFLVAESEALTYQYDLKLTEAALSPDPRAAHTLNLRFDAYGRVEQAIAAVYPRWAQYDDQALGAEPLALIRRVQAEQHLAYTETQFTSELVPSPEDAHRLPVPCAVRTYELTGMAPGASGYFSLDDFRLRKLSDRYNVVPGPNEVITAVSELGYHQVPSGLGPERRLVEHARTLYFDAGDGVTQPATPLPFGQHDARCLKYQDYKLALTDALLDAVFVERDAQGNVVDDRLSWEMTPGVTARALLADPSASGYAPGTELEATLLDQYWARSGVAGFVADARDHFYLAESYVDPFGNVTTLAYDAHKLFVAQSTDALANSTAVEAFDYRVLAPQRMRDSNNNISAVAFDVLGMPVALAKMGKVSAGLLATSESGETLDDFDFDALNPDPEAVAAFFTADAFNPGQARKWLGKATARFVYHLGENYGQNGPIWGQTASCACGILREQHEADAPNVEAVDPAEGIPIQVAFEYADGAGQPFVKKVQAEPDPSDLAGALRFIANGKTIVNNKGKPVLQYEPYFSASGHRFEESQVEGVSPLLFYDAPGRLIRTELPDGTHSRVDFSPWHSESFDPNDTVLESAWYAERNPPDPGQPLRVHALTGEWMDTPDQRAAWLAAQHAGTPARTVFDSLGREVVAISHNKFVDLDGVAHNEKHLTFTKLDAEGKPLWICDARGNLVMQYIRPPKPNHTPLYDPVTPDSGPAYELPLHAAPGYDVAGNLLFQRSMDAGDRFTLLDSAGKPMLAWDSNDFQGDDGNTVRQLRLFQTEYDALHRPTRTWLRVDDQARVQLEAFTYADTGALPNGAAVASAQQKNLIGQAVEHYEASGLATVERLDFLGNVQEVTRTLVADFTLPWVDWSGDRPALLESETFRQLTLHDALGRMTTLYNWHRDDVGPGESGRVAVYRPEYNERGLLVSETLFVRATKSTAADGKPTFVAALNPKRQAKAISNVTYDAKGQKLTLELGNGTTTRYSYDPKTYRLVHLYTRRDASFNGDCDSNTADAARPLRSCGVQNLHYTYDPVGNITHIQDDAQQTVFFAGQKVEPSNDYVYDALYRLIEGTGRENGAALGASPSYEGSWPSGACPSPSALRKYRQRYAYDCVGNILQVKHGAPSVGGQSGSYTRYYAVANDSNRLFRTWFGDSDWNAAAASDKTEYRHDPHGNMLNLAATAPDADLRWDTRDMIRSLDLGGGGWAYYNYGSDKQRTRKKLLRVDGSIEDRIYLGGYELYRRYVGDPQNPIEEIESLHLFEGEQRVLLVDDVLTTQSPRPDALTVSAQTLWRYQYGNHLGSVGLELDDNAQIISYEEYHPYGTSAYRLMSSAVEAPAKRYRYTGMERDEESGLSYHTARYYAPWLGRWGSADPAGVCDGTNIFQFVHGNPLSSRDTSGTQTEAAQKYATHPKSRWDGILPPANPVLTALTDDPAAMKKLDHAADLGKVANGVALGSIGAVGLVVAAPAVATAGDALLTVGDGLALFTRGLMDGVRETAEAVFAGGGGGSVTMSSLKTAAYVAGSVPSIQALPHLVAGFFDETGGAAMAPEMALAAEAKVLVAGTKPVVPEAKALAAEAKTVVAEVKTVVAVETKEAKAVKEGLNQVEARLMMHVDQAMAAGEHVAFTQNQLASLSRTAPKDLARQTAAFKGTNLDRAVRTRAMADDWMINAEVVPGPDSMRKGDVWPDFIHLASPATWDLTTKGGVQRHIAKYGPEMTPIIWQ